MKYNLNENEYKKSILEIDVDDEKIKAYEKYSKEEENMDFNDSIIAFIRRTIRADEEEKNYQVNQDSIPYMNDEEYDDYVYQKLKEAEDEIENGTAVFYSPEEVFARMDEIINGKIY